ncbi:MAG TPA: outer membrane beta-barrel protein [Candidatus Eisenbacteria bacterium]|jgi:opacity protein-like surface antigen
MQRKSLFLLLALALVALPMSSVALAGGWAFGVTGGTGIPTGDLADEAKGNAKTGFQVGGLVDYAVSDMFSFGVDGSYVQNKNDFEETTVTAEDLSDFDPSAPSGPGDVTFDKFKYNTFQIGAHGKYMFPMQNGPLTPYALVGLGLYTTTVKQEWTVPSTGNSFSNDLKFDSRFGGKFGLGAIWKASPVVGIGAEVNYNFVSEDKDKVAPATPSGTGFDSAQYVDVHAVVSFTVPSRAAK